MSDPDAASVADVVEYCRIQAGLLSGAVETMGEDADELLDEIDDDIAEIRSRLEQRSDAPSEPSSPTTVGPSGSETEIDLEAIEELESSLEKKQAIVESKQARMQAFQELAAGYTELASTIGEEAPDVETAIERVVRFEAENDAPAYFDDRKTLAETAAESDSNEQ